MLSSLVHALAALSILLLAAPCFGAGSGISLDGSLPHGRTDVLADPLDPPASSYNVLEEHGWVAGGNLFHSFLQFDVGPGDSVVFSALTPNLSNVIARVTGGSPSNIDGAIDSSQIPGADFYLLNPVGILFGPASSVNVPASLFIGTPADLRFDNGDVLDLVDRSNPVLSVATPEAFGFEGGGSLAEVAIASAVGSPAIEVPTGESLTIVADRFEAFGRRTLAADGGRIQIFATGTAAIEVPLSDIGDTTMHPATPLGEVIVRDQTTLSAANTAELSASQGTIVIRGGRFELASRGVLRAAGDPAANLAAIDVAVTGEVDIHTQGRISVDNPDAATGEIQVLANRIRVRDGGLIQTIVSGTDDGSGTQDLDGGALRLTAREIEVSGGGQVLSSTQPVAGQAGDARGSDLVLNADRVRVTSGGIVGSFSFAGGRGGDVILQSDSIEVAGGDVRSTASETGRGGDVVLDAAGGSVRVVAGGAVVTLTNGLGTGGNVVVTADSLEILDGGLDAAMDPRESAVEAGTSGSGAGGSITVDVGTLRIARSAGSDRAGRLATVAAAAAAGPSGDIGITADRVTLEDGGQISTTTLGASAPGSITIDATGDVALRGQDIADDGGTLLPSGIFTRSEQGSVADAGSIAIDAQNIFVEDGAEISTVVCAVNCSVVGGGASGSIDLTATGLIRVAGESGQRSAVTTEGIDGNGGDLNLVADVVEVLDGGRVDVTTSGSGTGGRLTVRTGDLVVEGRSSGGFGSVVAAQTRGLGAAQGVDVEATRSVRVEDGGEITAQATAAGTPGSPGDVTITAPVISLTGGRITTQAGSAAGGDITLTGAQRVALNGGAELSARSSGGDAGNIVVQAPELIVRDSQVVADADAFGGEVTLRGSEFVLVERSRVEAFSRGGGGGGVGGTAGGNVFIEGGGVVLNQAVIAADGFGNANGGNVLLAGDVVLQSTDTQITFSSTLGQAGTFVVNSPYTEVTGDLASLPENFLDASALLEEPCLARDAPAGSFAVRRVGELPPSPDAPLAPDDDDARGEESSECAP